MKEIDHYYKPIFEGNKQVGLALDFSELARDRAVDLFPKNKQAQQAFQMGFAESLQLSSSVDKSNQKFMESKKSNLILPEKR